MTAPLFYIGLHHPGDASQFARACLSVNVLRGRKKAIPCQDVLVDSGAFTEIATHGGYRHEPSVYAAELRRLHESGVVNITAAVSQDYMCEAFMLAKTGLTVSDHQRLTIERYDAMLTEGLPFPIMPVLQGYDPADYVRHIEMYGDRLTPGMWVGVGSVCKRNGRPESVLAVLSAIHDVRPDLRLHGFGLKQTALEHPGIRSMLFSTDSMAWSLAARRAGRNPNSIEEAKSFYERVTDTASRAATWWQPSLKLFVLGAAIALATPASAHCYAVWRYPTVQPGCPSHKAAGAAERHRYGQLARIYNGGRHRFDSRWAVQRRDRHSGAHSQIVRPDPPDAPSKDDLARLRAAMEMDR